MPRLTVINRAGDEQLIEADAGTTVMDIIRDNSADELLALCGGCCSCATCHVYIEPSFAELLPPITDEEDALLDSSAFRNPNSRLSCQIRMSAELDGLKVRVAEHD